MRGAGVNEDHVAEALGVESRGLRVRKAVATVQVADRTAVLFQREYNEKRAITTLASESR